MNLGRYQLMALTCGLGAANAMIKPMQSAFEESGMATVWTGFEISLVIWVALTWSLLALWHSPIEEIRNSDRLITLTVSAGLLFPLASISWLVTAVGVALWLKLGRVSELSQAALAILFVLALRDPMTTLVLKLFSTPLLNGDAAMVEAMLGLFADAPTRSGNIIFGDNEHRLLILTGCSSYTNLSLALLAWFSLVKASNSDFHFRQLVAGVSLSVAVIAVNVIRLTYMALGPDEYAFAHATSGSNLVEFVLVALTLSISLWGIGYARWRHLFLGYI